jgi:hypothetical protein
MNEDHNALKKKKKKKNFFFNSSHMKVMRQYLRPVCHSCRRVLPQKKAIIGINKVKC